MKNRFSLYKDASGYLNYKIFDKYGNSYIVSSDISSWINGEQHHIAASWKLNSRTQQDEMHLFIDGEETSNIIKYGSHISPLLHQKFRTISTEDIVGKISNNIVGSTDLTTLFGSATVSSSLNFTDLGINVSDIIYIDEDGFNNLGYTITNVNGNTLTLASVMPLTFTNCKFSINKVSLNVNTQINLYKNIAISKISYNLTGTDLNVVLSNTVSSASINFETEGIEVGSIIRIDDLSFGDYYTILTVSGNTLVINGSLPPSSGLTFYVYPNIEVELPGQNALFPAYEISRDGYFGNLLTIKSSVEKNDLILLRTLGLNHSRVKNKYYVWGNSSNILNTRLPSPLLLDDVKIYHTLIDTLSIGPSNSTLSFGTFTSSNILTDQPSISDNGRTLEVIISGDNIDYSSNILVDIYGTIDNIPSSIESLSFSSNKSLNTVGKVSYIDYIVVTCKPINSLRNCCTVKIKELQPITTAENSTLVPIIRFSYQMLIGNTLSGTIGSNVVEDIGVQFSKENVGNYLIIYSPAPVAGQYLISSVSDSLASITLSTNIPASFTNGNYEILNTTQSRSGIQNGRFTFEESLSPGTPYLLSQGLYELDYHTGLSIPLEAKSYKGFIGSDINKENQAKCIIDDFFILDTKLSDTRIGETLASGSDSITRIFNSIKALTPNQNTLMLLDFDAYDFVNNTDTYLTSTKNFIQSSNSVNSNFNKSICFTDYPYLVDNVGILNTKTEGTIEFWINSLNDTGNDPNYRFYFDASSAVTEEIVSANNATVIITGKASNILNIKIKNGDHSIDYFKGGSISSDSQTLYLNNKLPNQNTLVIVNYIPTGVSGDRISIYKDSSGYMNFNIDATGISHQVRAPIFWEKGTWHRIKAQYKINQGLGIDEQRLFIDGYEYGNILFGSGLLFGENLISGSSFVGHNATQTSISFTDTINEFSIGSDYTGIYGAYALIDNLRISNIYRPLFKPFGEAIDVNYSTNTDIVYPVSEDLYTTLILDFNQLITKTTDFAVLKNKINGLFDIYITIYDKLDILKNNSKSKLVLEDILNVLKPANSRLFIQYK